MSDHYAPTEGEVEGHRKAIDRGWEQWVTRPGTIHRHKHGEPCNSQCSLYPVKVEGEADAP